MARIAARLKPMAEVTHCDMDQIELPQEPVDQTKLRWVALESRPTFPAFRWETLKPKGNSRYSLTNNKHAHQHHPRMAKEPPGKWVANASTGFMSPALITALSDVGNRVNRQLGVYEPDCGYNHPITGGGGWVTNSAPAVASPEKPKPEPLNNIRFNVYAKNSKGREEGLVDVPYELLRDGKLVGRGKSKAQGLIEYQDLKNGQYVLQYGLPDNDELKYEHIGKLNGTEKIQLHPVAVELRYDDLETTPAGGVDYRIVLDDGTVLTGSINENGYSQSTHYAKDACGTIEFVPDEDCEALDGAIAELQQKVGKALSDEVERLHNNRRILLDSRPSKLPVINPEEIVGFVAPQLTGRTEEERQAEIYAALRKQVAEKIAAKKAEAEEFDSQNVFQKAFDLHEAATDGATRAITEYLPDLGEFGDLLEDLDIDASVALAAIATGDMENLEKQYQAWKQRNEKGMEEASEAMEIIILLLKHDETRQLLLSLPKRYLEVAPQDELVEVAVMQTMQLGMDGAVVSASTAAGATAGPMAVVAGGLALTATTARKAGKVAEVVTKPLMKLVEKIKAKKNSRTEQLNVQDGQHSSQTKLKDEGSSDEKKCPICSQKDKPGCYDKARHLGQGINKLNATNLYAPYDLLNHDWYVKEKSLAVHHVIPLELTKNNARFKKLFDLCAYDINGAHNTVVLPMTTELACELRVQRHNGPHSGGRGANGFTYPAAVKELLQPQLALAKKGKYCKTNSTEDFHNNMKGISSTVLKYIDNFIWTISSDGKDYKPGNSVGCGNAQKISEKSGNCLADRYHKLGKLKLKSLALGE